MKLKTKKKHKPKNKQEEYPDSRNPFSPDFDEFSADKSNKRNRTTSDAEGLKGKKKKIKKNKAKQSFSVKDKKRQRAVSNAVATQIEVEGISRSYRTPSVVLRDNTNKDPLSLTHATQDKQTFHDGTKDAVRKTTVSKGRIEPATGHKDVEKPSASTNKSKQTKKMLLKKRKKQQKSKNGPSEEIVCDSSQNKIYSNHSPSFVKRDNISSRTAETAVNATRAEATFGGSNRVLQIKQEAGVLPANYSSLPSSGKQSALNAKVDRHPQWKRYSAGDTTSLEKGFHEISGNSSSADRNQQPLKSKHSGDDGQAVPSYSAGSRTTANVSDQARPTRRRTSSVVISSKERRKKKRLRLAKKWRRIREKDKEVTLNGKLDFKNFFTKAL